MNVTRTVVNTVVLSKRPSQSLHVSMYEAIRCDVDTSITCRSFRQILDIPKKTLVEPAQHPRHATTAPIANEVGMVLKIPKRHRGGGALHRTATVAQMGCREDVMRQTRTRLAKVQDPRCWVRFSGLLEEAGIL
jgi:hypothetical protein